MERLKRKIDDYLIEWKKNKNRLPLIIKGARQIGKTNAIRHFGNNNYTTFIEINFALQPQFKTIFEEGFEVDNIIKNITLKMPELELNEYDTLIFFDEMQDCVSTATSLKSFREDARYDVICSGSLMGINYKEIESNSVGNKEDYIMNSLDFEEFLWAKGYSNEQINDLYKHMVELKPLSNTQYDVMMSNFKDYMIVGGMPAIVSRFVENKNFSGILKMQQQILLDYEEDITKYAGGLDKTKILNCYRKIPVFLGNENKKFQISKIANGARSREYVGVVEWLENAGIVNVSYAMEQASLPLKGNYNPDNYRLYFADTGLLISHSFDENGIVTEEIYKKILFDKLEFNEGMIIENMVAQMLVATGHKLYFYSNSSREDASSRMEIDFLIAKSKISNRHNISPIEVKSGKNYTLSSLKKFMKKYKEQLYIPYVIHTGDLKQQDGITYLPIYMTSLL